MTETPRTAADVEQIALNAIRWRATHNNDGKAMAQADRLWLLTYLDLRAEVAQDAARQRDVLTRLTDAVLSWRSGATVEALAHEARALLRATEGKQL